MEKGPQMCILCAYRGVCQKQFSMTAGKKCPDFARDLTIKETPQEDAKKD